MATPATVSAVGYYTAGRAGVPAGEATLRMDTATQGTLAFAASTWTITGDPAKKRLQGVAGASTLDLKIVNRRFLKGTVDSQPLELTRQALRPIPAAELAQSDPGPAGSIKQIMDATPDYAAAVGDTNTFWYAFGPVLYRGRLDGSARVLGIASDPGPTECLPFARRTLIGDSGQKTQGLLAKLGLTRSYVLVNAFAVALHPSKKSKGLQILKNNAAIRDARHALYNELLAGGALEAVLVFGDIAHRAYDIWAASNPAVAAVRVFKLPHPAAVDRTGSGNDLAVKAWRDAITTLRTVVTPDPDGDATGPNLGSYFTEVDYTRIPRWDLPSVAPAYVGDDSWGRGAQYRHNNCCERPSPDDGVSLMLRTPDGQALRYEYAGGHLVKTTTSAGQVIAVDSFGLPVHL